MGLNLVLFVLGASISLTFSWLLVSRLERLGQRIGLSEVLLGLVAALCADGPEITSAVTAVLHHQHTIGAGVVIGSNVFNLAALLGVAACTAGFIAMHRRVVLLGAVAALAVAAICVTTVVGLTSALVGCLLVAVVVLGYVTSLSLRGRGLARFHASRRFRAWLDEAIREEELQLDPALEKRRGDWRDVIIGLVALILVIGASATMERSASDLGARWHVAQIITGGIVLAAVTSLPNAVAAAYLARQGRGSAVLSTALNSNNINVLAGLLIPGVFAGIGAVNRPTTLVAVWYAGLTMVALALAYRHRGLRRSVGVMIIAAYVAFVISVVLGELHGWVARPDISIGIGIVAALACTLDLLVHRNAGVAQDGRSGSPDALA